MVKPGTYKATLLSHAISETNEGKPQAAVTFSFEAEGSPHNLTWYGSFSEKALPITLKALLVCGLQGNNPAGPLETGKEVLIVINTENDKQGRPRNKIQWVNAIGAVKNAIAPDLAKAKLAGLEGAVLAARLKMGTQISTPHDDDEIPF